MGSFYTSHTLRGPSHQQLIAFLNERPAFISTTSNSITTILDQACDSQDADELNALAAQLSAHFKCPVLAVLNHDDDVLYAVLYELGRKTDEYNSNPLCFDDDACDDAPSGGDAKRLAAAFGAGDTGAVEAALRGTGFTLATQRHQALAHALGMPEWSVGIGYNYAEAGDLPPWVSPETYQSSQSDA
jgi:hypothetical protein